MNKHVVNLELSKKLKVFDYPQMGEYWWCFSGDVSKFVLVNKFCLNKNSEYFVAPLASELILILQDSLGLKNNIIDILCSPENYCIVVSEKKCIKAYDVNLCGALAKMYIFLIENEICGPRKRSSVL